MRALNPLRLSVQLLLALPAAGQDQELAKLVAESEAKQVTTAVWFQEAGAERPFHSHRATTSLIPASNMKLFTAAHALEQLGVDYRFRTRFYLHETPTGPALRVESGGDPGVASENPIHAQMFKGLVAALRRREVAALPGGVWLDANGFTGPVHQPTWEPADLDRTYAAPTGPFVVEEACFGVTLDPADKERGSVAVSFVPEGFAAPIRGRVRLTSNRKRGSRPIVAFDDNGVRLEGWFYNGFGPRTFRFPADDPQQVFEQVLLDRLARAGIRAATAAMPEDPEAGVLVHTQETPLAWPLERLLADSNNFQAEQVLRVIAKEKTGEGTLAAGRAFLEKCMLPDGVDPKEWQVADASGLSRFNRVSVRVVADLLDGITRAGWRQQFFRCLAVTGESGTLARRMKGPLAGRVRGKTGTLSGVSSLAGFVECKSGRVVLFSIIMNYDRKLPSRMRDLRKLQDRMLEHVYETR